MFKFTIVLFALLACAAAKPGHLVAAPFAAAPLAYTAPAAVVAAPAPYVTATSSQVIARNYNGIGAAPVYTTAPVVARYAAAAPVYATAPVATPFAAHYATAPLIF